MGKHKRNRSDGLSRASYDTDYIRKTKPCHAVLLSGDIFAQIRSARSLRCEMRCTLLFPFKGITLSVIPNIRYNPFFINLLLKIKF